LPQEVKLDFERRERVLDAQSNHIRQSARRIEDDWNWHGGARQQEIEHNWMAQLKNDSVWDTGTALRSSRLWTNFLQHMREAKQRMKLEDSLG
jgi:hypothetical protein